jgi:hypothetical protein
LNDEISLLKESNYTLTAKVDQWTNLTSQQTALISQLIETLLQEQTKSKRQEENYLKVASYLQISNTESQNLSKQVMSLTTALASLKGTIQTGRNNSDSHELTAMQATLTLIAERLSLRQTEMVTAATSQDLKIRRLPVRVGRGLVSSLTIAAAFLVTLPLTSLVVWVQMQDLQRKSDWLLVKVERLERHFHTDTTHK